MINAGETKGERNEAGGMEREIRGMEGEVMQE
jgi:hypothetical protein